MKLYRAYLAIVACSVLTIHPVIADTTPLSVAERSYTEELLECASYYDISSEAISAMNAPQMQAVASRLVESSAEAKRLAAEYLPAQQLDAELASAKQAQIMQLKNSQNLGGLMAKYKDSCKQLLADPKQRLEYWQMVNF
ncbi:hypothetical protein [Shewanella sp. NIFS-20-20]|uniref:hypothetical protein n=1 Tax=Shewanella sp. NIFS-20-20 TaxID=2853806 RepID=UPI001C441C16|nr:hypothetical protein [Shewanella sp. NIFS-20-20]MBV7317105.1 hypothetical protein [Shewanella sp. NIFS-20-20]